MSDRTKDAVIRRHAKFWARQVALKERIKTAQHDAKRAARKVALLRERLSIVKEKMDADIIGLSSAELEAASNISDDAIQACYTEAYWWTANQSIEVDKIVSREAT